MKIKKKTWFKNFTVTVPVEMVPQIKRRAASQDRSVSGYICSLIRANVETLK